MDEASRVVVVGAGPAGIAAAGSLARAGLAVTLLDEARQPGGQVLRAPAPGLRLDMARLLGTAVADFRAFHAAAAKIVAAVDYRPETLAWNIHGGAVHIASRDGLAMLPYAALVLATGAIDRVLPVRGWTLPGVFTLGGAQALLKEQGCLIGRRVVFCGSSPLLYVAAQQYLRMGGQVAAVLDSTGWTAKLAAMPDLLAAPVILAQGLRAMATLRQAGVVIRQGAIVTAVTGDDRVAGVAWRQGGRSGETACDAVACGHGLKPETQLAELAGVPLRFSAPHRLYLPQTDADGRAGAGIYLAGDGAAIGGATAAAVSGRVAAVAVLADLGLPAPDATTDRAALRRLHRFQRGIARAFAWPHARAAAIADDVTLCRCEAVTAGALRTALGVPIGTGDLNRAKAATRCGMGRCQGRFCAPAAAEIAAACLGRMPPDRFRAQPPVKPLPLAAVAPIAE